MKKDDSDNTIYDGRIEKFAKSGEELQEIVFLRNLLTKKEYPISRIPFIIGRSQDCSMTIDDEKISRIHCTINRKTNTYILEDMGSTNGTLVNDHPILKWILKNGDLIGIGDETFLFVKKGKKI